MRDLSGIIRDNGGDNRPALDSHNLTGRANAVTEITDWSYKDALAATLNRNYKGPRFGADKRPPIDKDYTGE